MVFIIVTLVDTLTLMLLCSAISERRFKATVHWSIVAAFMIIGLAVLRWLYGINPWLKFCLMLLWFFSITFLYKGSWLHRAILTILHFNISVVTETVLLTASVAVSGETVETIVQSDAFMLFLIVVTRLTLTIVCLFLRNPLKRRRKQIVLPIWEWLSLLLVAGFTVFESFPSSRDLAFGPTFILPIRVLLLLFMNIALIFLPDKLAKLYQTENEKFALQEQMRYNKQSLQITSEAYEAQRRLTHDFDNCLHTLAQLLQHGQSDDAVSYLQTKLQDVVQAGTVVSTNNSIADAVLNQKFMQAQNHGIQMQFLINDLSGFPLSTDELVTVLANLLDNALESCLRCSGQETKTIKVKLLLEPALSTISVKNSSLPIDISASDLPTSKPDPDGHGFGLKNVKGILTKNDFDFAISCEAGWFQFTAIKVLM